MAEEVLCNLCGNSCIVGKDCSLEEVRGLVHNFVRGGYESTPGNGHGALDDGTEYRFSICEFCLDWLFSRFVIPVRVVDSGLIEEFVPAAERIKRDDWRKMKQEFIDEAAKRDMDRKI